MFWHLLYRLSIYKGSIQFILNRNNFKSYNHSLGSSIHVTTLGVLIRALPPIRALPGKNVEILIRALPPIRVLLGKLKVYQS